MVVEVQEQLVPGDATCVLAVIEERRTIRVEPRLNNSLVDFNLGVTTSLHAIIGATFFLSIRLMLLSL